jgi:hypothetical protein
MPPPTGRPPSRSQQARPACDRRTHRPPRRSRTAARRREPHDLVVRKALDLTSESPELELDASLIIRGRIPWILLAVLWGGIALGAASLFRGRNPARLGVLLLEIASVGFTSWYVILGSVLPAHALAIEVGDPFPAYALRDQDEALHERAALEKRPPALYIFYRGHW